MWAVPGLSWAPTSQCLGNSVWAQPKLCPCLCPCPSMHTWHPQMGPGPAAGPGDGQAVASPSHHHWHGPARLSVTTGWGWSGTETLHPLLWKVCASWHSGLQHRAAAWGRCWPGGPGQIGARAGAISQVWGCHPLTLVLVQSSVSWCSASSLRTKMQWADDSFGVLYWASAAPSHLQLLVQSGGCSLLGFAGITSHIS